MFSVVCVCQSVYLPTGENLTIQYILYSPLLTPASSQQDMFELVQLRPHYTSSANDI